MIDDPVLVDTGPLVALYNERDALHETAKVQFAELRPPLLTCWPVVTETVYLVQKYDGDAVSLLEGFSNGLLELLPLDGEDIPPIAQILKDYRNINPQLADASLICLAAEFEIERLFTFDRRDFSILRLPNGKPVQLLPPLEIII